MKKVAPVATKDGAILCHTLSTPEALTDLSHDDVAKELARCLQEVKHCEYHFLN